MKKMFIALGIALAIIFSAVSINNARTAAEAEYKQQSCEQVCDDIEGAVTQIADVVVDELNPDNPYEHEYDNGYTYASVNSETGGVMVVSGSIMRVE